MNVWSQGCSICAEELVIQVSRLHGSSVIIVYWISASDWSVVFGICICLTVDPNHTETALGGCVGVSKFPRIVQIPISYVPRKVSEGKKLTMAYGWTALCCVWKYRK